MPPRLGEPRRAKHAPRVAQGLAVLLSAHDPDHAFSVGNRVALLDGGRLIAQGPPAEVLTPERLRAVYGVSVVVERLS